jgi:hypothetical protein
MMNCWPKGWPNFSALTALSGSLRPTSAKGTTIFTGGSTGLRWPAIIFALQ